MRIFLITLLAVFAFQTAPSSLAAKTESKREKLSLADYLDQVRKAHLSYLAASMNARGNKDASALGELALSPMLIANSRYLHDARPTSNVSSMGDLTSVTMYSLGVAKLFSSGTQAKVAYEVDHTDIEGTSANFIPNPKYYDGKAVFEISQPLWRNFFGSETRAQVAQIRAQFLEASFLEQYRTKQILAGAEMAYWKLHYARRTVRVRESSRDRANRLKEWSGERVRLHLADRSDVLQADAAFLTREIELQRAVEDAQSAAMSFNAYRGVEASDVTEDLVALDAASLDGLEAPARSSLRDDVKAADQRREGARSNAQLAYERARPNLDLSAGMTFAGRNSKFSTATGDSFSNDHPIYSIGVSLSAPLEFWKSKAVKEGAQLAKDASELDYQRKVFDQEREWADTSLKFHEAKKQIEQARELERIQDAKLSVEQDRLRKGRTTTFQVLVFEQDFAMARMTLIQLESELLSLYAQMKTYLSSTASEEN